MPKCGTMLLMSTSTIGEILRPTKGADSYPRIANRANQWLRSRLEAGARLSASRISAEHVRRIFEDQTERPRPVYLQALAAAQQLDPAVLLEAAGYWPDIAPDNLVESVRLALRRSEAVTPEDEETVLGIVQEIQERRRKNTP